MLEKVVSLVSERNGIFFHFVKVSFMKALKHFPSMKNFRKARAAIDIECRKMATSITENVSFCFVKPAKEEEKAQNGNSWSNMIHRARRKD